MIFAVFNSNMAYLNWCCIYKFVVHLNVVKVHAKAVNLEGKLKTLLSICLETVRTLMHC